MTLENEIELIKGCRAGKDSARKELYTLYSKQMLAVCFRYTGDMDAAHDVLHDGFIKIFTNFSFRGESSLCTWITRVMVTQSLDFLRREKRVSQLVVHEEQLPDIPDISDSGGGAGISEEQLMAFIAEFAAVGFKRLRLHKTVVIRDSPGRLIGAGNDVVDDA